MWDSSDVSSCQSTDIIELETQVQNLTAANVSTLMIFTSELSNITSTEGAILPQDAVTATNILTMIIE